MTIYIFGNPLVDFDNLPLKLKKRLAKLFPRVDFVEIDPNDNLKPIDGKLYIIDTAEGIEQVRVLTDIDKIESQPVYSAHDFDLGLSLKLLKKINLLKEAVIFCVPQDISEDEALRQLKIEIDKITAN